MTGQSHLIEACERTHPGRRDNNEDTPLLVTGPDAGRGTNELLFGVVDGMGGYEAGEVASVLARDAITRCFADGGDHVVAWMHAAHNAIVEDAERNPQRQGMGAVASFGLVTADRFLIAHVGDTRIYRVRNGEFVQLTEDQSAVGEMVRAGHLDKDTARTHRMNNVVLEGLGHPDKPPHVAFYVQDIRPGDTFLACSDGLTDVLTDAQVSGIIGSGTSLDEIADELVDSALVNQEAVTADGRRVIIKGGKDNITVVVVRIPGGNTVTDKLDTVGGATSVTRPTRDSDMSRKRLLRPSVILVTTLAIVAVILVVSQPPDTVHPEPTTPSVIDGDTPTMQEQFPEENISGQAPAPDSTFPHDGQDSLGRDSEPSVHSPEYRQPDTLSLPLGKRI